MTRNKEQTVTLPEGENAGYLAGRERDVLVAMDHGDTAEAIVLLDQMVEEGLDSPMLKKVKIVIQFYLDGGETRLCGNTIEVYAGVLNHEDFEPESDLYYVVEETRQNLQVHLEVLS